MTFVRYVDANGQFRWRLVAANGKIVANSGEGYINAADCDHAVNLVKSTNASTPYIAV